MRGAEVLADVPTRPAEPADLAAAGAAVDGAVQKMGRHVDTTDIRDMLAPLFEDVEIFSQAEAIDFVGSAALRRTESNHLFDRMVMRLGVERLSLVSRLLARLRLTSRVSVRCARRED